MIEGIIQQHAILLKDKVRMEAYRKAISRAVKPGDTVLDIGCGLGILSFLALKAGAGRVHAVEAERGTLRLARLIAGHNGLDDKITFHGGLSTKLKLKKKADILIAEIFGNLCFNENILPIIIDARDRLLKNGGTIIPQTARLLLAPCEERDWAYTAGYLSSIDGFDLLPDLPEIDAGTPSVIIKNTDLLADPKVFGEIDLRREKNPIVSGKAVFDIGLDGLLSGFAGWFEASLTDEIRLTTAPSGLTTHWRQGFLPLRSPQRVRAGQKITLWLKFAPDQAGLNSIIDYSFEIA